MSLLYFARLPLDIPVLESEKDRRGLQKTVESLFIVVVMCSSLGKIGPTYHLRVTKDDESKLVVGRASGNENPSETILKMWTLFLTLPW